MPIPILKHKIIYIFISCQKNLKTAAERIRTMMKKANNNDYIIVSGGGNETTYDSYSKIVNLKCNDNYEGLPEKVFNTIKYIMNDDRFNQYSHICKLDDDMIIQTFFTAEILDNKHYLGIVEYNEGARDWHIGRCSIGSKFNTSKYTGIFVPWCKGGYGYILSRMAMNIITQTHTMDDEIYEDVGIAKILYKNNIHPENATYLRTYITSPDHI